MIPRRTFHTLCTACLVTLFSLFTLAIPSAVSAADTNRLQKFVDSGRLPSRVHEKLKTIGTAEVMILFDVSDITAHIKQKQKARGLNSIDTPLRIETRERFISRRQNILSRLTSSRGHRVLSEYDHLPMFHLSADESTLNELLQMPEITVNEIKAYRMNLIQSLPLVGADDVHAFGYTGSGTSVAVLDTGTNYTLSAFGSCTSPGVPSSCKVASASDFAPNDNSLDDHGHGTNVSGIVVGVAPDTRILSLDVFDGQYAYDTDIVGALNWVIANRDVYNTVAVNLSLGDGIRYSLYCSDTMTAAITALKNNGIISAVASGNEGYTTGLSSPACGEDALSVGAVYDANVGWVGWSSCTDSTTAADKVACFSNTASYLKMLAPGAMITAAGYTMSGTSMAAPHVAGAIAVMKEESPSLSPDQIVSRLTGSGTLITDPRNGLVKPRLDLYATVTDYVPLIGFAPTAFDFYAISGSSTPRPQILSVRNDGSGTMNWSVTDNADWLSLLPASGMNNGEVTVSVIDTNLAPGTYNALIAISSPEAPNSPQNVPVTYTVAASQYSDDFETGDFSKLPWMLSGDGLWSALSGTVYGGLYSAQSPALNDDQLAGISVTLNISAPGYVKFRTKALTDSFVNQLKFRVDGVNSGKWDGWYGDTGWIDAKSSYQIQPGVHTFTWVFSEGNPPVGSNYSWLDDIVFPAFDTAIANINVSPSSHDFGAVPVTHVSLPQIITVTNSGSGNLDISSIIFASAPSNQFMLQNDSCSGQTLLPSANCNFEAVYLPTTPGVRGEELHIASNDLDTPVNVISLSGSGIPYWTMTTAKTGTGTGTVNSVPAGIACGADCSESYLDGEMVTLSAAPDANSSFTGWSGGGCSGTGNCVVTMTSAFTVTATFSILPPVAAFSGSSATGNAPLVVTFSDSSTNSPTSWAWNFGDYSSSTVQNPVHLFEQPGSYDVSLTAANASGSDSEAKIGYITAGACPTPPVAVGAVYYDTITEAYADPLTDTGDVLLLHGISFTGDLVFGRDIEVVLAGGNNCEYTAAAMGSRISGSLTISAGTVTVENLIIL